MKSEHHIFFGAAQDLSQITDQSVDLMVTSPPYPMIEMWDTSFFQQNIAIKNSFKSQQYLTAFEQMHIELDKVWQESFRVLKNGGIACINIGDATRTLNKNFQLFSNHARIIQACLNIGFQNLPNILWQKTTNAPNKFMGSGMLPPGAYVTLEHEYILIFRKGQKRLFKSAAEKANRQRSAYFWEERNQWFSDIWQVRGAGQQLLDKQTRDRSAAYPFEIPYRLIHMFSAQNDTVLDPFLGTGTTTLAAMQSQRNSIGIELELGMKDTIFDNLSNKKDFLNQKTQNRLAQHLDFITKRKTTKGQDAFKYTNDFYGFPVITKQEQKLIFPIIESIERQVQAAKLEVYYTSKLKKA